MIRTIANFFINGWRNLWKEKLLWLFAVLGMIYPLFVMFFKSDNSQRSLIIKVLDFIFPVFYIFSEIGITHILNQILTDQNRDIKDSFLAVRKYFWRFEGTWILSLVLVSPFLCGTIFLLANGSISMQGYEQNLYFLILPFSFFSALQYFWYAEIIFKNSGVFTGLKTAWRVFIHHFGLLAIMGFILQLSTLGVYNVIGIPLFLIQNNFNLSSLGKFNFGNPNSSFSRNSVESLILTAFSIAIMTFSFSVFISAYHTLRGKQPVDEVDETEDDLSLEEINVQHHYPS